MLINYDNTVIHVEKKAIRHAYMRIRPDGSVTMTVNKNLPLAQIESIIHKSFFKLKPKIEHLKNQEQLLSQEQNIAYYLGNKYQLVINYQQKKKEIFILNNQLIINLTNESSLENESLEHILNQWYKKEAIKIFNSRFDNWFNRIETWKVLKPSLSIRSMQSRFGSYAKHKHKVTLNLWLVKAPLELLDYVIAHELSHIRHFNHSKHFYNELAVLYPNWHVAKKELNAIAKVYCNSRVFL